MQQGAKKAILAAFFANLGIAISKFVGFILTSSAGLLAESVNSLADTANQGLLFLGGRRAARASDEDHPFGHERERFFWAFIVALVLFSMGVMYSLHEGIQK
ncbi:MAG: cation diffusion facilitator family transporter, partial [Actinomycetota bacterium]